MKSQICLIDASKCIGCRACQAACKQWNQLPAMKTEFTGTYENPPQFSCSTWTKVVFREYNDNGRIQWLMSKQGCMHCTDAACKLACPTGAIYHTDEGTVAIERIKCIGCNYCAAACPFQVIGFDRFTNRAEKCTFCYDRLTNGLKPACSDACPTGSLVFGEERKIFSKAQDRVEKLKNNGNRNARIYGLEEVDGTAMLYVLADSPEKYGLPADPRVPLGTRIWNAIYGPLRILVVIAVGFGLWANLTKNKEIDKAKEEAQKGSE